MIDTSKRSHLKLYKQCKTMKDYFDLINSSELDYFEFFNSISKKRVTDYFRHVTRIKNIMIEPNTKIADARNTSKILPSEQSRLSDNNFNYGYNAYTIKGDLEKLIKKIHLYDADAEINCQLPGQIKALHFDSCAGWMKKNIEKIEDLKIDHKNKQPKHTPRLHRFLVALQDWQPGWMVQFGTEQWSNWKKGDVITFDWRNVPHSTANASFENRYLLKITGITKEDTNYDLF